MLNAGTCLPVECVQAGPAFARKALPTVLCTFRKFPYRKPAKTTITDHTAKSTSNNFTGTYKNSTNLVLFTGQTKGTGIQVTHYE